MIRTAYTRWHEMEQIFRNDKNKKKVINIIVKFIKSNKCPQLINSPCIITVCVCESMLAFHTIADSDKISYIWHLKNFCQTKKSLKLIGEFGKKGE